MSLFAGVPGSTNGDVIDALAISEVGVFGVVDRSFDEVLFFLTLGSPSLGGALLAKVYYSDFTGSFSLFADNAKLGLLANDNIDSIDVRGSAHVDRIYIVTLQHTLTLTSDFTGGSAARRAD